VHKFPSQSQIDTAIMWLESNEGEGDERGACEAVALWLGQEYMNRYLRSEARKAGVPVTDVRERLNR
jgi:hypothetical protein